MVWIFLIVFEVAKGEKTQPYFQLVIIYFQLWLFSCTKDFLSVFKIYGNMQKYAKNTEKLVTKSFGPKAFWVLNEIISETLVWSVRTMQNEYSKARHIQINIWNVIECIEQCLLNSCWNHFYFPLNLARLNYFEWKWWEQYVILVKKLFFHSPK